MLPAFQTLHTIGAEVKLENAPLLPPFTPHSKLRSTSQNKVQNSWKLRHQTDRFPPLMKSETPMHDDEVYVTSDFLSPVMNIDQHKCFQSTTVLRSVPIMRRHLDTFGGRTFSLPAKTKPVPFHTGRFIYNPGNRPTFVEELTQNERLEAEMAMVEKVRGLKRKREALEHRWGWRKLDLSGFEVQRGERYSLQNEVKKLKELILPPTARDIYTGRGIRMPENHHTKRSIKRISDEPIYAPPPSTNLDSVRQKQYRVPSPVLSKSHVPKSVNSRDMAMFRQFGKSSSHNDLVLQIVPAPGIVTSPTSKTNDEKAVNELYSESQMVMKMHEPVEQIEVVAPVELEHEDEDGEKLIKAITQPNTDTPVDRSRSMAAPSASPDGRFRPLVSVSAVEDGIATEQECEKLKILFMELDDDKTQNLTFKKLQTTFPDELTQYQSQYLHVLYDLSTQHQTFGSEEFIAMSSLAKSIVTQTLPTQEMFEKINYLTLEESLTQYTELFSSVDRAGRGRIGISALLQILSTTLQRQLDPDTNLAQQIMATMKREYSDEIARLEFLCMLPYFLFLEDMT